MKENEGLIQGCISATKPYTLRILEDGNHRINYKNEYCSTCTGLDSVSMQRIVDGLNGAYESGFQDCSNILMNKD